MRPQQHALATREGFAEAYDRHARSILIFLARRTCDPETAMDLAAETFAQAFASRRRFRGRTDEDAAAWFFAIARNVLSRYVRRGTAERRALTRLGVEVPSLEPEDLARVVELAGLDDLRGAVARELGALTDEHRAALQLRVVEQLPYDDIARRLAISETAARARVSRGLRTIGRALDPKATIQERLT
jgi:RNA polymerase sigma-70 factor (ECF subfamily)